MVVGAKPRAEDFYQPYLQVDSSHIYWWTKGPQETKVDSPGRANLDGSGKVRNLVATPPIGPLGLDFVEGFAIDGSHIYWPSGSGLARSNLDGSGYSAEWLKGMLIEGATVIEWIAVSGGYIYYIGQGEGILPSPVGRVKTDGTGLEAAWRWETVSGTPGKWMQYLTNNGGCMTADANYLYLPLGNTPPNQGAITRLAFSEGSTSEILVPKGTVGGGWWEPEGAIAVNSTHVYWLARRSGPGHYFICRARLDGTEVEREWQEVSTRSYPPEYDTLNGLAADNNYVYWTEITPSGHEGEKLNYSFIARRSLISGHVEREWISGAAT